MNKNVFSSCVVSFLVATVLAGGDNGKLAVLRLSDVFAPRVVVVPPTAAARDLCRTADGEIRHYGWGMADGKRRRVYISSRDNGLNWTTVVDDEKNAGPMVQSPWSGEWVGFEGRREVTLVRSKTGPGDRQPERTVLSWNRLELRQLVPLRSRRRWLAAFSDVNCLSGACYRATTAYSDDDGRTWTRRDLRPVADVPRLSPGDKRPHWYNDGCEPTFAELADGSILLCVRTSGPHAAFYRSEDGGETWLDGRISPDFWQTNTMPYLFRLRDGRLLFIWNNTAILPTRELAEYPELKRGERSGQWESVFTNRDALHAAISDDDGRTWRGFRELALNTCRNAADFRELGNGPCDEHDKSVHQTQALELPDGKVLLAYGQNSAARRILIFDPDWLLEDSRTEDFRHGLGGVSTHLYVRSLSGGYRGWAGHDAWNRVSGALLVRDPETDDPPPGGQRSVREVLQLCRIRDPRLVCDRQGVVWNFPAARKGSLKIDCHVAGCGFRLTLSDHWMNPCDEVGPSLSPFSKPIDFPALREPGYHVLTVAWDGEAGTVTLSVDGRRQDCQPLEKIPRFGFSYLHVQTLAEETDARGAYFRSFRMDSRKDASAPTAEKRSVPLVYCSDIFHPAMDPDDHFDLAAVFRFPELDLKAVILDGHALRGERDQLTSTGGRTPLRQMMKICGREVPYAVGLDCKLTNLMDRAENADPRRMAGVELMRKVLEESSEPVVFKLSTGTDFAVLANRWPDLVRAKVKAVYLNAGIGDQGEQREYNVACDLNGYDRIFTIGVPLYWAPCFTRLRRTGATSGPEPLGWDSWFHVPDQSVLFARMPVELKRFFVYAFGRRTDDPIAFLEKGETESLARRTGRRNMWSPPVFAEIAGRKVYRRGENDYVWLSPADAARAGLADRLVDAYGYEPVRVTPNPAKRPAPAKDPKLRNHRIKDGTYLEIERAPERPNAFEFRQHSPDYTAICISCLSNLYAE